MSKCPGARLSDRLKSFAEPRHEAGGQSPHQSNARRPLLRRLVDLLPPKVVWVVLTREYRSTDADPRVRFFPNPIGDILVL